MTKSNPALTIIIGTWFSLQHSASFLKLGRKVTTLFSSSSICFSDAFTRENCLVKHCSSVILPFSNCLSNNRQFPWANLARIYSAVSIVVIVPSKSQSTTRSIGLPSLRSEQEIASGLVYIFAVCYELCFVDYLITRSARSILTTESFLCWISESQIS